MKKPTKPKESKADLGKETYKGDIPSIIGRQRLLVRSNGKESFIYVDKKDVGAIQSKYGGDFIRNCGEVVRDVKYKGK